MIKYLKLFQSILIIIFLAGCQGTDVSSDISTTEEIHLGEVSKDLKDKIDALYNSSDSDFINIQSTLSSSVHSNTAGVSIVYYTYDMNSTYDTTTSYYFEEFQDNHSNESWLMLERDEANLVITESNNYVLTTEEISFSTSSYYDLALNPYTYYYLFFDDVDYTNPSEGVYSMSCLYGDLIKDPLYNIYFWDFGIHSETLNDEIYVNINFEFLEDSLVLTLQCSIYLEDDTVQRVSAEFVSTLSFPNNVIPFTYNYDDYYHYADTSITDNMLVYHAGEEIILYVDAGIDGIVKFELEPGYYFFGNDAILQDSENNIVENKPFYKITESGYYYIYIVSQQSGLNTVYSEVLPEGDIGTIDSPIISSNEIDSNVTEEGVRYHLIDIGAENGYIIRVSTTYISDSGATVFLSCNEGYILSEGIETYVIVKGGQDVILRIHSDRNIDYSLLLSIIPYTEYTENIDDMLELPHCYSIEDLNAMADTPNIFIGGEPNKANVKFEITESGEYIIFIDYLQLTGLSEHDNLLPQAYLYDAEGNFLMEWGPLIFELEAGTYYIEVTCYEGETAIIQAFIQPEELTYE